MGLSASQGRLLLLTAKRSDLEFRAQQISQKRLLLSQQLEEISMEYEEATSNRIMNIMLYQSATNNDANQSYRTTNLTYASLMSGTVTAGLDPSVAGVQASDAAGTKYYDFTSNTFYRLTSVDGAIVVSDVSEIPGYNDGTSGTYTYTKKEPVSVTPVADQDGVSYGGNLHETLNETQKVYSITPATGSALADILSDKKKSANIQFDKATGIVKYTNDKGELEYYNIKDGTKIESFDSTKTYDWQDATLYANTGQIPQGSKTVEETGTTEVKEGSDGVITIYKYDKNGNSDGGTRYVVDPALRYGSTDANGSTSGPNYLQDCLRNGKYLLQKGSVDNNNDEGFKWSNVSWDATTNISDSYYTADDDAAKAKYDRLQNQIQAQDKKLELELDNIETQRSAVTTEIESVEKVINDNVENTFNAFG